MKVHRLPVGQLQTNCYLVIDEGKTLIIDPGDDADYIQRIMADEDVVPTKIIATHAHYDHVLAITELKLAYKIPFLMHQKDEFLLKDMSSSASYFSGISTDPAPKVDKYLQPGSELRIDNCKLKIIHTPGHTPGSISLYSKDEGIIFVGDLLFAQGGVGRTDFRYSSTDELEASINTILELPKEIIVYSGHGSATTIGDEFQRFGAKPNDRRRI